MVVETVSYSFSELLSNIVDNRGKTCPVVKEGVPLIATNCIKNETLFPVFEKARYVDSDTYDNWFRGHPEPGDMIFVTKGSPGNVCWTPDPVNFCIAQDMVAIRANSEIVDAKYLFALLRSKSTQHSILNMHVGTLIPHFKKGDFKNLYFDIPKNMSFQRSIGEIYFSLCERIELNRQMNATLESMAQALFKSWFVDFDPVIDNALAAGNPIPEPIQAKAAARQALGDQRKPFPEEIRQQFPDRFVFNEEMGWVPEGWVVEKVGDVLELAYGKSLPASKRLNGDVPVYGSGGVSGYHNESLVNGPSIIVGRKGTVGSLYWVEQDSFPIDTVFYVINKSGAPLYWLYHMLERIDIKSMGADSAVPGVNRNTVYAENVVLPSSMIFDSYATTVHTISNRRHHLEKENILLSSLRDTLLPKLLSGELRIPDAEKQVAEAI